MHFTKFTLDTFVDTPCITPPSYHPRLASDLYLCAPSNAQCVATTPVVYYSLSETRIIHAHTLYTHRATFIRDDSLSVNGARCLTQRPSMSSNETNRIDANTSVFENGGTKYHSRVSNRTRIEERWSSRLNRIH